jgi:uncharacterized membrane protein/gas vesicle protein
MIAGLLPLAGAAVGAVAMYLFDPDRGRRRRALLRDQVISAASHLDDTIETIAHDLAHRAQGLVAEARSAMAEEQVSDEVLVNRVRAKMGRVVSHPGAVEVTAVQGRVILSGAVLEYEHEDLLQAARAVEGVREVEDRLEVHKTADGISALQGGHPRPGERFELMQENWSPAARVLVGAAGSALGLYAFKSRTLIGLIAGAAGTAMFLRSATNMPLRRLAGMTGRRAIDIQKMIKVDAPLERVFDTLTHYENFPQFMTNVREVKVREDGSSHWTVAGPGGISVEWEAVTTKREENRLLAWRTVPGAIVEHAGMIHFERVNGGTRLDIKMSYNPPAGALGHVVAKLFGADPKTKLDEDLLRMKTFLETGKAAHDAAAGRT